MPIDWHCLKNEYITTNISQRALAEKHGLSLNAVRETARKERWFAQRGEHRRQRCADVPCETQDDVADRAATLSRISTKSATFLENRLDYLTPDDHRAYEVKAIMETARIIHSLHKDDADESGEQNHHALVDAIRKAAQTHED